MHHRLYLRSYICEVSLYACGCETQQSTSEVRRRAVRSISAKGHRSSEELTANFAVEVFGATRYSRGGLIAAAASRVVGYLTHALSCMTSSRSAIREGFTVGVSTRNNTIKTIGN